VDTEDKAAFPACKMHHKEQIDLETLCLKERNASENRELKSGQTNRGANYNSTILNCGVNGQKYRIRNIQRKMVVHDVGKHPIQR